MIFSKHNKITNCALTGIYTTQIYRGFLYFIHIAWYLVKHVNCNFTHGLSSVSFHGNRKNAQQHYLHTSCTAFHPNRTINVESARVKHGFNSADFHENLSHRINGDIRFQIVWKSNKTRRK
jgi:hypothetical protein